MENVYDVGLSETAGPVVGSLDVGVTHWVFIRQVGQLEWSAWHMPFR